MKAKYIYKVLQSCNRYDQVNIVEQWISGLIDKEILPKYFWGEFETCVKWKLYELLLKQQEEEA
jgi:hypothetical protein